MLAEAAEACRDEGLTSPSDAFVLAAGSLLLGLGAGPLLDLIRGMQA